MGDGQRADRGGHGPDVRPGMVAAVHTASSDLRWHPHVHALASRGVWDRAGSWHPVPYVDTHAAELLLRQKVIAFLAVEDLLDATRIELLDSWKGTVNLSEIVFLNANRDTRKRPVSGHLQRLPISSEARRLLKLTVPPWLPASPSPVHLPRA